MSFGPSNTSKIANNNLAGISSQATNTAFPLDISTGKSLIGTGQGLLNQGGQSLNSGTNFFNTLLNGNQANTTALLQPNIDQIRNANQNSIQSLSTLMPRGGGRSGTLFGASYAPNAQIQSLFNGARSGAAGQLGQLGLGQEGIGLGATGLGTNLFNTANSALGVGAGASGTLGNQALAQKQMSDQELAALGQAIFGLATTPFGGGSGASGLLGLLPKLGGG